MMKPGILLVGLLIAVLPLACNRAPSTATPPPPVASDGSGEIAEASREQVEHFCAACHLLPQADSFPRHRWQEEVEQGYRFYEQSNMKLKVPPLPSIVKWFENRAPQELPLILKEPAPVHNPFRFQRINFPNPNPDGPPAISNVHFAHLTSDKRFDLLVCEMQRGQILLLDPLEPSKPARVLSTAAPHPAHVEVVDLDGDGRKDLLVADLGDFFPTDERVGRVLWLRGMPDGSFKAFTLLDKVGRVADVQAADFSGDGKLDLVVAAFGWNQTGEIIYLENQTTDWNQPTFVPKVLDKRHGGIHVPVADLNGDGKPDFVALISQESEVVVAFINDGQGNFTSKTIYQGPHPAFGSSGIQLVDLDGDGKLDVLYCNGDTLDRKMLRPYHGIHWLRNTGSFPFEAKRLASMYGVHRALAADFLGRGRLGIVGVALLPEPNYVDVREQHQLDAVIMLEQVEPGKFVRHSLERVSCDHATADVADIDGDGRADFVTGSFSLIGAKKNLGEKAPPSRVNDWVTVWRNVSGK
jgi:FG-GAP-like repeat